MNRLLELKQNRAKVAEQAKALVKKVEDEKRAMKPEEVEQFDKLYADLRGLNGHIDALEKEGQIDGMISESRDREARGELPGQKPGDRQRRKDPEEQIEAFRSYIRAGAENLVPEQRNQLRLLAGNHNSMDFRTGNPQSDVTGNLGGYTVPQGFYARVIEALKYYAGMMESEPFVLETAMGNDMPVPTADDTSQTGAIFAENTQITTQEIAFGQVILKAYKYSSKIILVPIELLQDSGVDIEAFIIRQLGIRLGRILNTHLTSGDGSSKPRGVLIDSVTGVTGPTGTAWSGGGSSGSTGGIDYNSLVNLKYSVNRLYRVGAKFMMNDNTLAALLQLKDSNNRPLILDYLTTLQEDEPEKLLGQPIVINNDMPNLGSVGSPLVGNQAILYGQFSNYWVRRVMAMIIMRLTERYADLGQVGFLAFMRQDGRMVDAGQHPIKAFVSATS